MKKWFIFLMLLALLTTSTWLWWPRQQQSGLSTLFYKADNRTKAPLIILLGGSEGGFWYGNSYEALDLRRRGYHVLSIAYFGVPEISPILNRIELTAFEPLLAHMQTSAEVIPECIGIVGVSKGAELALLLGSHYPDLHMVVGVTPSHVAMQASNVTVFQNSSWAWHGEEVPYVPFPRLNAATLKGVMDGESYLDMHLLALSDKSTEDNARIAVENINGPILLISGKHDQMWPSEYMADQVMQRLQEKDFAHPAQHIAWDIDHYILDDPLAWSAVGQFIDTSFEGCGSN